MAGKTGMRKRAPLSPTSGRQRIWNALRVLRKFTSAEVMATSEQGEDAIKKYLKALLDGGYLRIGTPKREGVAGGHRGYVLIRDTGPLAPRVSNDGLVDPNLTPAARAPGDQFVQVPRRDYERALKCVQACAGLGDDPEAAIADLRARAGARA